MFQPEKDLSKSVSRHSGSVVKATKRARNARSKRGYSASPFSHMALLQCLEEAPVVQKKDLMNRINYLHFTESPFYLYMEPPDDESGFLLRAYPEPCHGDRCTYRFVDNAAQLFDLYTLRFLFVPCDRYFLIAPIPIQMQLIQGENIAVQLPETAYKVDQRGSRRYPSRGLSAVLTQDSFQAEGELQDFSPAGLNILLTTGDRLSLSLIDRNQPVQLQLSDSEQVVLTSPCTCVRLDQRHAVYQNLILLPGNQSDMRLSADDRRMRNPRQQLSPSFTVSFEHPLIGKRVRLQIHDMTTSGFSIVESVRESLLIPGLILSDMTILYAGVFKIECRLAQVVYRSSSEKNSARCGVAILDMDLRNYTKLANILTKAIDPYAEISCEVDMDDLWDFFFDSGFIYPKKYKLIQSDREEFKRTYEKLYHQNSDIVRHFTYQKNGRIFGHISLVRAYEKSWMFHHLSAKSMEGKRPGPRIIKQITHFIHDLYRFPSVQMDYYMCYYQPTNRFSSLLFGGFAKQANDPKVCSQDLFSYFICENNDRSKEMPAGWVLDRFAADDYDKLNGFYAEHSGGMLLDAIQMEEMTLSKSAVEAAYRKCGFKRNMDVFSLHRRGELKAVMIVNQTEYGLNLSNLLNCVKVIVCDQDSLPWEVLEAALEELLQRFSSDNIPVLLYPSNYVKSHKPQYSTKEYLMWVIDARHMGEFMVTTKQKTKIGYWE